jgi:CubicO group peptidase (beta-lactamase class C family)
VLNAIRVFIAGFPYLRNMLQPVSKGFARVCAMHGLEFPFLLMLLMFSCKPAENSGESEAKTVAFQRQWDSISNMTRDINACYMAFIDSSGRVYEYVQGKNSEGRPANDKTIFEGASLSKTVFSYMYWHLSNKDILTGEELMVPFCKPWKGYSGIDPSEFLSHTYWTSTDSCVEMKWIGVSEGFRYSENGYILLQKSIEARLATNLEDLGRKEVFQPLGMSTASFLWDSTCTNFVNGHYEKDKLHRPIRRSNKAFSNGTLYINGKDLLRFTKNLMISPELDSMACKKVPVPGFSNLEWGRGMGMEWNKGDKYMWQWGSNWSYHNLILINTDQHTAFICLTNSIIGAKRIRETVNWLHHTQFQLFDYIKWY